MTETAFDFEFPSRPLADRVVLVSGASGGLGSAASFLLAAEGARLVLGYHDRKDRARRQAAELKESFGTQVRTVGGDIGEAATREALISAARDLGTPYGMACFSGNPGRIDFSSAQIEDFTESLQQNYGAPLLLARDFAASLRAEQQPGAIVLLSSMQATGLFPGSYNYAGPKSALVHVARIMAKEWGGPHGIRVNVVAPGVTAAGMALASIRSGKYDHFVQEGVIERFGRAEDVAKAVRFLLEPDNYVTGQVVTVDGGLTLRA